MPEIARPAPCFACLYQPADAASSRKSVLIDIAQDFSPRYQRHRDDLVSIDISGLQRLLGAPRAIGLELRREAAARGIPVHVAVAGTRIAALVLSCSRPGLTVVDQGDEAAQLAALPIRVLRKLAEPGVLVPAANAVADHTHAGVLAAIERWGLRTLGEFAALTADDVSARLGADGVWWHAVAHGQEVSLFVPDVADERFEGTLELEWPIEGIEPLSFVLTRLLEPIAIRLERRDRGAARLRVSLGLVTREQHERSLELPTPIRDVRTLRTLALLDLESHRPAAAIDCVTIPIEPTPGRVLQHTLFTRAQPTPEQVSTLIARLTALLGADRIGAAAMVDTFRPGAFAMRPFAAPPESQHNPLRRGEEERQHLVSAVRRYRQPVPARVKVDRDDRPVSVTTDRRGIAGGTVIACAGPWRSSGEWWGERAGQAGQDQPYQPDPPYLPPWNRDEWDVALIDRTVYRIFRDRLDGGWFIDAITD